jgi:chromate transporter
MPETMVPGPSVDGGAGGLVRLAWALFRIGAVAFGGLGSSLALIERELVGRRRALAKEDITEALTYTKLLPGSTAVQVVAYLGWRLGGWPGSAVATASFLLPSAAIMLALGYGYSHLADLGAVAPARRGVLAAVVGLLLLTLHRLAAPALSTLGARALALGAFLVVGLLGVSAVLAVVAAGSLGVVAACGRGR